jgi:Flp pilus assembly protein TadD
MKKMTILLAGAAGYVLGARAGRQRYEQIASGARSVMRNPKVQSATQQAQDAVSHQAAVVGEKAKDAVSSAASTAADKVRGNGGSHAADEWPASAPPPGS